MKPEITAEELIDELLATTGKHAMSLREQYLLRETLYSLTRLVRSEQMLEIRQSVARLIPASLRPVHIRHAKGKRNSTVLFTGQRNLAFGRFD